jgi:hypothetical protein
MMIPVNPQRVTSQLSTLVNHLPRNRTLDVLRPLSSFDLLPESSSRPFSVEVWPGQLKLRFPSGLCTELLVFTIDHKVSDYRKTIKHTEHSVKAKDKLRDREIPFQPPVTHHYA